MSSPQEVAVWLTADVPTTIVWDGRRFRVSDTPTPLRDRVLHPALTHPLEPLVGWRFQATDESGASLVFDVRLKRGKSWELVAAWS